MVEMGEALQVVEARDLVAWVLVEKVEETMVPQENLWLKQLHKAWRRHLQINKTRSKQEKQPKSNVAMCECQQIFKLVKDPTGSFIKVSKLSEVFCCLTAVCLPILWIQLPAVFTSSCQRHWLPSMHK